MKLSSKKFMPFIHDNLELKNALIDLARKLKGDGGFSNQISSAFIYINFVEYLAGNLLDHLCHIVHHGTYNQFAGILFVERSKRKKTLTLGQIVGEIEKFSFPDKTEIIDLFQNITTIRNKIFHEFATLDIEDIRKVIEEDVACLQVKSENLLTKLNIIYLGLQKILSPEIQNSEPEKTK